MPSALEKLVKILKLEREQGYKNTAVIGGLKAFGAKWAEEAHTQARRPEHHTLVDDLNAVMGRYDAIASRDERHNAITYMLDRITGRIKPPGAAQDSGGAQPPAEPQRSAPPAREKPAHPERGDPARAQNARPAAPRAQAGPPRRERRDSDSGRGGKRAEGGRKQRARGNEEESLAGLNFGGGPEYTSLDAEFDVPVRTPRSSAPDAAPQPTLARPPRRPRPRWSGEEAADILRGLNAPVTTLRGVGPKRGEALNAAGIFTLKDLLYYLPRRYDDYTRLLPIGKVRPGIVTTVIGTVTRRDVRVGKGGRRDFAMELYDGTGRLGVMFFGQHFLIRTIHEGQQLVVSGETAVFQGRVQMTNPEWEPLDGDNLHTTGIVPVYPLKGDLRQRTLREQIREVVNYWSSRFPDYVPEAVLERCELADVGWALRQIHFPEGWDHLRFAKERLIFDDLLLLQLAILQNRRAWQALPAPPLAVSDDFVEAFVTTVFPYPLTGAQRRAIEDVQRDVATDTPMNRLLQGDVGAGKTAVATTALALAFAAGKQGALMAPTSILAEQHYRNIARTLEQTPGERTPRVALLTAALPQGERDAVYAGLADGSIDVVIGTHALIQAGVAFSDLAVAIIDEQHRFGVEQRKLLRGKGQNPHLLVMTATPIPRTLALTLHADLDLSVLDEMPPGRQPVQTRILEPVARERIYDFIKAQIDQGRQAFIVHPLVEESETVEARSAVQAYEELQYVFHRHKLGLLHGRMKAEEKDEVMRAFAAREFDVLVTTSVAEVGVDIPNASVIVIESAERFGLAQLHQFRGRVGRGEHSSFCLLITENRDDERLQALAATNDGFLLAEVDWKLRGSGDLLGTAQSGSSLIQLARDMSPHLVELAQREARTLYEDDPELAQPDHSLLAQRVRMLLDERTDVS